jgi:phosphoenolpyruvate-protein kinase (PTS system EI component)
MSLVEDVSGADGYVVYHGGTTTHQVLAARARGIPVARAEAEAFAELAEIASGGWVTLSLSVSSDIATLSLPPLTGETGAAPKATVVYPATIYANVDSSRQARVVSDRGINDIGMWRTERYLESVGLIRNGWLSMWGQNLTSPTSDWIEAAREALASEYARILATISGKVAVRLLDVEASSGLHDPSTKNPALGVRGVRASLCFPALLDCQIDCLTETACSLGRELRLLLPMVSNVHEVAVVKAELNRLVGRSDTRLGVALETPRSVVILPTMAELIDFVTLGTNDLLQFFWGADRDKAESTWLRGYEAGSIDGIRNPFRSLDDCLLLDFCRPYLIEARSRNSGLEIGVTGDYGRLLTTDYVGAMSIDYLSLTISQG